MTTRQPSQGLSLLRALADQGHFAFTAGEAREAALAVGVAQSYLPVLLHRLYATGLVRRVKRGTYTLSTALPGVADPHPFAIGMALVDPCAISGWAALNHHGFTEQIPRVVTLTTPRRVVTPTMRGLARAPGSSASVWEVEGQRFEIVTVVPSHFFGVEMIWLDSAQVKMFDRERALLDCFALPRRFGGVVEGLAVLEEQLPSVNVDRLVAYAERYGKASVAKRVGYALELAGAPKRALKSLQALPITGYRPLDPTRPREGVRNDRWGLIENLSLRRTTS